MAGTMIDVVMQDLSFLTEPQSEPTVIGVKSSPDHQFVQQPIESWWRRMLSYLPFAK